MILVSCSAIVEQLTKVGISHQRHLKSYTVLTTLLCIDND